MVVVEMVVHGKFFDHRSVVWSLRVVWSRSPRGRSRCERVALERVQLRVHVDEVAALVDNLACKRGTVRIRVIIQFSLMEKLWGS